MEVKQMFEITKETIIADIMMNAPETLGSLTSRNIIATSF